MDNEKLYGAYFIAWNHEEEEYEYVDSVEWDGKELEFDTYAQFLAFMASLSKEQKESLGEWRLENRQTDEYISISDGIFDDVSFLSLHAEKTEAENT